MNKTFNFLKKKRPNDVMMLTNVETKACLFRHARDANWTMDKFQQKYDEKRQLGEPFDVAILCKSLFCLDFDDKELGDIFEQKYECLKICPKESTRKGYHFILSRTKAIDYVMLFDGARQFACPPSWGIAGGDGEWTGDIVQARAEARKKNETWPDLAIDVKSLCSTKTGGVLVIAPSANKQWIRELSRTPIPDVEEDLLKDLQLIRKKIYNSVSKSSLPRQYRPLTGSEFVDYLNLIKVDRWNNYADWMELGQIIFNYGTETQTDMLWCWLKFSAYGNEFTDEESRDKWSSLRYDPTIRQVSVGTLKKWAQEDNPLAYALIHTREIPQIALDNWNLGDRGLVKIAQHLLQDSLKLSAGRGKRDFYHFDDETCLWTIVNDSKVKMLIADSLDDVLRDIHIKFANDGRICTNQDKKDSCDKNVAQVLKCLQYIRSNKGVHNILSFGSDCFSVPNFDQQLDTIPYLLAVRNGVIDLRTGLLRERTKEDMLFKICEVDYNPDADDNWVRNMVLSAMADDEEMANFLQKLFGYSITGETSEEVWITFTGSGRNAKGSLMQTLSGILGNLYVEMNNAVICDRKTCNIDAERAKLQGARICVFNELDPDEKMRISEVQLLSGGDAIPCKPLYKDPITINPQHQCFLTTNHMPTLADVGPAIVERMIVVPFKVTFRDLTPEESPSKYVRQRDDTLKARLSEDRPAFLKWLVDGAVKWYAEKHLKRDAPNLVKSFTKEYLNEQDALQKFIDQNCEQHWSYKIFSQDFLEAFNDENPDHKMNNSTLTLKMKQKGFLKKDIRIGKASSKGFEGLRLKNDAFIE